MKTKRAAFFLLVLACSCGQSPKDIETEKRPAKARETKVVETKPVEKEKVIHQKKDSTPKKVESKTTHFERNYDCVFDQKTQTDSFIKDILEFANYKWVDITKTAHIALENGDSIYAHRGGCHHFGVDAAWIQQTDSTIHNTVYWIQKATWLAERIYHPSLMKEFRQKLRALDYEISLDQNRWVIFINHDYYSEWSITVTLRPDGKTVLTTAYFLG